MDRARAERDRPRREAVERERARAERQRRLLAQEWAPRAPVDRGPLFGLDRDTVRALSGGTL